MGKSYKVRLISVFGEITVGIGMMVIALSANPDKEMIDFASEMGFELDKHNRLIFTWDCRQAPVEMPLSKEEN